MGSNPISSIGSWWKGKHSRNLALLDKAEINRFKDTLAGPNPDDLLV